MDDVDVQVQDVDICLETALLKNSRTFCSKFERIFQKFDREYDENDIGGEVLYLSDDEIDQVFSSAKKGSEISFAVNPVLSDSDSDPDPEVAALLHERVVQVKKEMRWDEIEERHQEKLRQRLELTTAEDSDSDLEFPADVKRRTRVLFDPKLGRDNTSRSSEAVLLDADYNIAPESKSAREFGSSRKKHANQSQAAPVRRQGKKTAREKAPPPPLPPSDVEKSSSPDDSSQDHHLLCSDQTHNTSAHEADSPKDQDNTMTASASISSKFSPPNLPESDCYLSGYYSEWEKEDEGSGPAQSPEVPASKEPSVPVLSSDATSSKSTVEHRHLRATIEPPKCPAPPPEIPAPPPETPTSKESSVPILWPGGPSLERYHPVTTIQPLTYAVPRQSICQHPHPPPPPSPLGYQQHYEYRSWTLYSPHTPTNYQCDPPSLSYGRHSCSCCTHDLRSSVPPPHICAPMHHPPTTHGEPSQCGSVGGDRRGPFGRFNYKTALEPGHRCSCCHHDLRSSAPSPHTCTAAHLPPTTCGELPHRGSVPRESFGRSMNCKRTLETDHYCPDEPQHKRCCFSL